MTCSIRGTACACPSSLRRPKAWAAAAVLLGLNSDPGRRLAERLVARTTGGQVSVAGLAGAFPSAPRIGHMEIHDAGGVWLTVEDAALDWSLPRLLAGEVRIDALTAARVIVARLPTSSGASQPASANLPVPVDVERLHVDRLELGAPVVGVAVALSVQASARVASVHAGQATLALDRLDGPGSYRLDGAIEVASI